MGPLQKAWVEALRSGEYKQTQDRLQVGDSYCCLGVACVVAEKLGVTQPRRAFDGILDGYALTTFQPQILKALKIRENSGEEALVNLNDCSLHSFSQIADYIEQHESEIFSEEA
jgi:hypothetical protein